MGSAGSMFTGFMLAVVVLTAAFMTPGSTNTIPVVMPILIMGVPLYDTASVIIIRLVKEDRSRREIRTTLLTGLCGWGSPGSKRCSSCT